MQRHSLWRSIHVLSHYRWTFCGWACQVLCISSIYLFNKSSFYFIPVPMNKSWHCAKARFFESLASFSLSLYVLQHHSPFLVNGTLNIKQKSRDWWGTHGLRMSMKGDNHGSDESTSLSSSSSLFLSIPSPSTHPSGVSSLKADRQKRQTAGPHPSLNLSLKGQMVLSVAPGWRIGPFN